MEANIQKEQFSIAYVRALAAVAGVKVWHTDVDDESVDMTLERTGGGSPRVDLQLKYTADPVPLAGDLPFTLKLKNYDDLRAETIAPRFLVVLFVPRDSTDWLALSMPPDQLVLRRCALWTSLQRETPTTNEVSVTVRLPRSQVLTVSAVHQMLDKAQARFRPLP